MDRILDNLSRLGNIRSLQGLYEWFLDQPLWGQIIIGLGGCGLLIAIYIFLVAGFMDKEN